MWWCDNSILQCIGLPSQAQQATALPSGFNIKIESQGHDHFLFYKGTEVCRMKLSSLNISPVNIPDAFLWQVLPQVRVECSSRQTARHFYRLWHSEECHWPRLVSVTIKLSDVKCVHRVYCWPAPRPIRAEPGHWPLDWPVPGSPIGQMLGYQGPCPGWGGDIIWPIPARFESE